MLELYPNYYSKFTCTADQCPITCCQEWKIAVDDDTYRNWFTIQPPTDVTPQKATLSAYTTYQEEARAIRLNKQKKCPFLKENGLCRLVLAHGDAVLSDTCTTFPREFHTFSNHIEKTLMPSCPAVIDLWKEETKLSFPSVNASLCSDTDNLLFSVRSHLISLMQNSPDSPEHILLECFYILLELQQQTLSSDLLADYFSESVIGQLSDAIEQMDFPLEDTLLECNELLQDLAVNYQKEGLYSSFLTPLLALADQISEGTVNYDLAEEWDAFEQQFFQYQALIRNFLANEFFSDLLSPDGDLESMIVQMQWIGMEYGVVRHSIFLKWLLEGKGNLCYEVVRDSLVILTRMTGYEKDDIYEYLENSFDSLYWDWGYFAMIISDFLNVQ